MAKRFGSLPEEKDIHDASYDEVKIAPVESASRKCSRSARHFNWWSSLSRIKAV